MNIYVLNTIVSGWDTCEMVNRSIPIDGYIDLTDERKNSDVSGYFNAKDLCGQLGIEYHEVKSYNLSKEEDKNLLLSLDIDVLLVAGWQRLVPEYLIDHCKVCVIGAHGSPLGITEGRGRSPQNWALMLGLPSFEISIFKIDAGIDSGEVIDSREFEFSCSDDIQSSYLKISYLIAKMTIEAVKSGKILARGEIQNESTARYLPKRSPEDGMIDWNRTAEEINDFIRALTKPYPGAFTSFQGRNMHIWSATAFTGDSFFKDFTCGELIFRYINRELLIRCGDGAVIVRDYETDINFGDFDRIVFESANFEKQIEHIIEKHYEKYPDLKISEKLLF